MGALKLAQAGFAFRCAESHPCTPRPAQHARIQGLVACRDAGPGGMQGLVGCRAWWHAGMQGLVAGTHDAAHHAGPHRFRCHSVPGQTEEAPPLDRSTPFTVQQHGNALRCPVQHPSKGWCRQAARPSPSVASTRPFPCTHKQAPHPRQKRGCLEAVASRAGYAE